MSISFRPFERTAAENDQIHGALKHFDVLAGQVPANVLKELCVVAQLDVWKEQDLTSKSFINTILRVIQHFLHCRLQM